MQVDAVNRYVLAKPPVLDAGPGKNGPNVAAANPNKKKTRAEKRALKLQEKAAKQAALEAKVAARRETNQRLPTSIDNTSTLRRTTRPPRKTHIIITRDGQDYLLCGPQRTPIAIQAKPDPGYKITFVPKDRRQQWAHPRGQRRVNAYLDNTERKESRDPKKHLRDKLRRTGESHLAGTRRNREYGNRTKSSESQFASEPATRKPRIVSPSALADLPEVPLGPSTTQSATVSKYHQPSRKVDENPVSDRQLNSKIGNLMGGRPARGRLERIPMSSDSFASITGCEAITRPADPSRRVQTTLRLMSEAIHANVLEHKKRSLPFSLTTCEPWVITYVLEHVPGSSGIADDAVLTFAFAAILTNWPSASTQRRLNIHPSAQPDIFTSDVMRRILRPLRVLLPPLKPCDVTLILSEHIKIELLRGGVEPNPGPCHFSDECLHHFDPFSLDMSPDTLDRFGLHVLWKAWRKHRPEFFLIDDRPRSINQYIHADGRVFIVFADFYVTLDDIRRILPNFPSTPGNHPIPYASYADGFAFERTFVRHHDYPNLSELLILSGNVELNPGPCSYMVVLLFLLASVQSKNVADVTIGDLFSAAGEALSSASKTVSSGLGAGTRAVVSKASSAYARRFDPYSYITSETLFERKVGFAKDRLCLKTYAGFHPYRNALIAEAFDVLIRDAVYSQAVLEFYTTQYESCYMRFKKTRWSALQNAGFVACLSSSVLSFAASSAMFFYFRRRKARAASVFVSILSLALISLLLFMGGVELNPGPRAVVPCSILSTLRGRSYGPKSCPVGSCRLPLAFVEFGRNKAHNCPVCLAPLQRSGCHCIVEEPTLLDGAEMAYVSSLYEDPSPAAVIEDERKKLEATEEDDIESNAPSDMQSSVSSAPRRPTRAVPRGPVTPSAALPLATATSPAPPALPVLTGREPTDVEILDLANTMVNQNMSRVGRRMLRDSRLVRFGDVKVDRLRIDGDRTDVRLRVKSSNEVEYANIPALIITVSCALLSARSRQRTIAYAVRAGCVLLAFQVLSVVASSLVHTVHGLAWFLLGLLSSGAVTYVLFICFGLGLVFRWQAHIMLPYQDLRLLFCPHVVDCVLAEFPHHVAEEALPDLVLQKIGRLARLNIDAKYSTAVRQGVTVYLQHCRPDMSFFLAGAASTSFLIETGEFTRSLPSELGCLNYHFPASLPTPSTVGPPDSQAAPSPGPDDVCSGASQ